MYVEDLNAIGINITAEIPDDQAIHFKEMCKLFASIDSHEHNECIDEYLLRLSPLRSVNTLIDSVALNRNCEMPSTERTTSHIDVTATSALPHLQQQNDTRTQANSNGNQGVRLMEKVTINTRLPSATVNRQQFELEIFAIIVQFVLDLDPAMKLFPFGSTQYGLASINSNFNLLITTGQFLYAVV